MKKLLALMAVPVLLLTALTGCGGGDVVSTDGSTSMEKVVGALIEAYERADGSVTVNYSGTGSGAGVEAVLSGTCDIGLASRALKSEEEAKGAVGHVVALDGVAVVVHPDNALSDLTVEQIAGIFTGRIANWKDLGGADAPIAVYGREAGSGTRGAFEEIIGVSGACRYTSEYSSTGDIIGNVSQNPNGIGYTSLSGVGGGVKALRVEGAPCTGEAIRSGSYPIQRPFLLVTSRNAPLSPAAQSFLDFALSGDAAAYIALGGAVAP